MRNKEQQENGLREVGARRTPHSSPLTPLIVLFVLGQVGCIPHYNIDGPPDGADNDQVADGGQTDKRGGDNGLEVVPPDVSETDQHVCVDDVCVCQSDCAGKECGDDGCGGSCGTCSGGKECQAGVCVCTPQHHKGCSGGKLYWYDSCNAQGVEVDCDDDNPCTDDGCSGSQCTHSNKGNDTPCGNDMSCQGGACEYHCGDGLCADAGGGEDCILCPVDCGACECEPGVSSGKKTNGQYGVVWVEIPAGCFVMGCSPGDGYCSNDEKPPHEVMVSKFEMMETEVTEAQYEAVTGEDPSCDYNGGGGPDSPVECIDWDEAVAFCEAVDPKGRLCTEAEWEYAARGGTTTKYYCGDNASCLGDTAWYDDNSGAHKHDVKSVGKQPNAYGLYDMLGNVWEWVEDCWHIDYDLNDDGEGDWDVGYPAWTQNCGGSYRVLRGGCFAYGGYGSLRVSSRFCYGPSYYHNSIGGRCCRSE